MCQRWNDICSLCSRVSTAVLVSVGTCRLNRGVVVCSSRFLRCAGSVRLGLAAAGEGGKATTTTKHSYNGLCPAVQHASPWHTPLQGKAWSVSGFRAQELVGRLRRHPQTLKDVG